MLRNARSRLWPPREFVNGRTLAPSVNNGTFLPMTVDLPNLPRDQDQQLIKGLACGDPGIMIDLYARYERPVYSLVRRIVGKRGEAEEITQETFLRIWTRATLIDVSRTSIGPWILAVARNLAIDHLRAIGYRERLSQFTSYEILPASATFGPSSHHSLAVNQVRRKLGELSPNQRAVIECAYFEGLTHVEISERLGRPLGTIKTWVRTGLESLKRQVAL